MFYDERVEEVKGRSLRKVIITELIAMAVYGIAHAVFAAKAGTGIFGATLTEFFTVIAGLLIVLTGELRWHVKDEYNEKMKFEWYSRTFRWFVYIFIISFLLKLFADVFGYLKMDVFSGGTAVTLVEKTGVLMILFSFKKENVMFNSSFMNETTGTYCKKVAFGVLRLGLWVLAFAVPAAIISLLKTGNFALFLSFATTGALVWFSLAFDYVLISAAERSSDKALEKGGISVVTVVFAVAATVLGIFITVLQILFRTTGFITNGKTASLASYISNGTSNAQFMVNVLFVMLLYSEIKHFAEKRMTKAIAFFTYSFISEIILSVTSSRIIAGIDVLRRYDDNQLFYRIMDTYYLLNTVFQTVTILANILLVFAVIRTLSDNEAVSSKWKIPVIVATVCAGISVLYSFFGDNSTIPVVVYNVSSVLISVCLLLVTVKAKKRLPLQE